jgi:hypothetical protein
MKRANSEPNMSKIIQQPSAIANTGLIPDAGPGETNAGDIRTQPVPENSAITDETNDDYTRTQPASEDGAREPKYNARVDDGIQRIAANVNYYVSLIFTTRHQPEESPPNDDNSPPADQSVAAEPFGVVPQTGNIKTTQETTMTLYQKARRNIHCMDERTSSNVSRNDFVAIYRDSLSVIISTARLTASVIVPVIKVTRRVAANLVAQTRQIYHAARSTERARQQAAAQNRQERTNRCTIS